MSAATASVAWTDERRRQRSEQTRARNLVRWSSAEARKQQSEAIRQTHSDPAGRAARTAAIRAAMSTPAFKAKRSEISRRLAPVFMETNRRNGNVRESRAEREFVEFLRDELGADDVVHHPPVVNGCSVDVYVRSSDAFIQFDGVYYHGLDRPYDQLSPEIRRKYDRDRALDAHFERIGQRLIRITDLEWSMMTTTEARRGWLVEKLREERTGERSE